MSEGDIDTFQPTFARLAAPIQPSGKLIFFLRTLLWLANQYDCTSGFTL
jgi:hypothetical protein